MLTQRFPRLMRRELLLLLGSLVLSLLLLEVMLRVLIPAEEPPQRLQFWSQAPLKLLPDGAVRYHPHKEIRIAVLYDGAVEYDHWYRTNDMGFVDEMDYRDQKESDDPTIAIVGDSFGVGIGNGPWIPELRKRIPGTRMVNLSVIGASLQHFLKTLQSVSEELPFDEIVLLVISDDFQRAFWKPLLTEEAIRFCPLEESKEVCMKRKPLARLVGGNFTHAEILQKAVSIANQDKQCSEWCALRMLRIVDILYRLLTQKPLIAGGEGNQHIANILRFPLRRANMQALAGIREAFPDRKITLVHLPQKDEVQRGRYNVQLQKLAEKHAMDYVPARTRCMWSEEMFHDSDPHLNAKGYEQLTTCVQHVLSL